jgi:signal transduction histidine kinase/ligand-binding sensor domain-containing protein
MSFRGIGGAMMAVILSSFGWPARRGIASIVAVAVTLLTGLLCSAPAVAVDATQELAQLHHTRWGIREGAPGEISSLAQTPDGMLWLGATTGLYTFDGIRFDRWAPRPGEAALNEDVSGLTVTPSGELWIGMRFGGVHRLSKGVLKSYGMAEGAPPNAVFGFARTRDGSTWAASTVGLYRLDGERWAVVGVERGLAAKYASAVALDGHGALWVTGPDGIFVLPPGKERFEGRLASAPGWGAIALDRNGDAWLSSVDGGLIALSGMPLRANGLELGDKTGKATGVLVFDRDGGTWIVQEDGLTRFTKPMRTFAQDPDSLRRNAQRFAAGRGLTGDYAFALLEDREGNIWAGTNGGLDRIRSTKLHGAFGSAEPMPAPALAVSQEGVVWAISGDCVRVKLGNSERRFLPPLPRSTLTPICESFFIDRAGRQWAGLRNSVLTVSTDETIAATPAAASAKGVQATTVDGSGAMWASLVGEGLGKYERGTWTLGGGLEGLPAGTPLSLVSDAAGRLWAGYTDNRLALVEGKTVQRYGPTDGIAVGSILSIYTAGAEVWIGGTRGVAALRSGKFQMLRFAAGAPGGISGIAQAPDGELWLNGSDGITRVPREDVAAFAGDSAHVAHAETLNFDDGLEGVAPQLRPLQSAVRGSDGRIWFATSKSVFWIDPARIPRNTLPPTVRLRSIQADGRAYPVQDEVRLPPATSRVEIAFTALTLTMPERVRFKYMLTGFDTDWQDSGKSRQVSYTNLAPKTYRFLLRAVNEDGVWSQEAASLVLVVPPTFTQSRSFLVGCVLAAAGLLWLLYRIRLRSIARVMRSRIEERLRERERIARELHDTLLQSTQGMILSVQGAAAKLPRPDPVRAELELTLDRADKALGETRDKVRGLRSSDDSVVELSEAFATVGRELSVGGATSFKASRVGTARLLDQVAREEIYWAGREALLNAFAHAGARAIEVEVIYADRELRVLVRDDGRGIDPEVMASGSRPGHWGLVGMRERTERHGAEFKIYSRADSGTEVQIQVPAAVAYRDPMRPSFWRDTVLAA